jgi:hypothetical protein
MKKLIPLIICSFIVLCFIQCKKSKEYDSIPIKLSLQNNENDEAKLVWTTINSADFKRYDIYKSITPIPDPTASKPISPLLKIASISDKEETTFFDEFSGSSTIFYYKVVAVLSARNLVSNQVIHKQTGILVGSYFGFAFNKPEGKLYMMSNNFSNRLHVYDFIHDTLLKKDLFLSNTNNIQKIIVENDETNTPYLYVMDYNGITSEIDKYNANTLQFVKTYNFYGSVSDFLANKNRLYIRVSGSSDSLLNYNMTTETVVNKYFSNNGNMMLSDARNYMFTTENNTKVIYNINNLGDLTIKSTLANSFINQARIAISNNTPLIAYTGGSGNSITIEDQLFNIYRTFNTQSFSSVNDISFNNAETKIVVSSPSELIIYNIPESKVDTTLTFFTGNTSLSHSTIIGNTLYYILSGFDINTGLSNTKIKKRTM